jgi:hypothetical protein
VTACCTSQIQTLVHTFTFLTKGIKVRLDIFKNGFWHIVRNSLRQIPPPPPSVFKWYWIPFEKYTYLQNLKLWGHWWAFNSRGIKCTFNWYIVTGVSEEFAYSDIGPGCFWDFLNLIIETNCPSETSKTICGATPRHIPLFAVRHHVIFRYLWCYTTSYSAICGETPRHIPEEINLCPAHFVICLFIIHINQPTRCKNFSSLLLDVYVQLNMLRMSSRPSSEAQQLQ